MMLRRWFVVGALLCCARMALGAQLTIYASTDDGFLDGTSDNYATAHSIANFAPATSNNLVARQVFSTFSPSYELSRAIIPFDTSAIPAGATITSVVLGMKMNTNEGLVTSFNVEIRRPASAVFPLGAGNQTENYQACLVGTLDQVFCATNSCGTLNVYRESPALDPTWIIPGVGGTTVYCITDARDTSGNAGNGIPPTGTESVFFDSAEMGGTCPAGQATPNAACNKPYLTIVYSVGPTATITPLPTLTPTPTSATTPTRLPCFDGSPGPNCTPPRCGEVTQQ